MAGSEVKGRGVLRSLGLHRPELRAWALYDWANSAFATTVMAAVFPIFFRSVAAADLPEELRSPAWAYTTSVALLLAAVVSPVLGAVADYLGAKKRLLGAFLALGTSATAALALVGHGQWIFASSVFIVANLGFAGGNVFYESLLPHVVRDGEMDRVSTAGYAVGYIGGGILLALNLLWILQPEWFGLADTEAGTRLSLLSVAVWWGLFSIPLFLRVPEPAARLEPGEVRALNPVRVGFRRVWATLAEIRSRREIFVFLLAFWLYNDGVGTIIKMATTYGAEIGIGQGHLIGALLLAQFVGIPFTFAFGALADRVGTRNGLYVALWGYVGISIGGYFMETPLHFWGLAFAVAMFQGGIQGLSRSLYATLVPRGRSSEFFGFYSVSAKFAGIFGPFVFGVVAQLTGGSRAAVLSLFLFFVGGLVLLRAVDVEGGRRLARAEDRRLEKVPSA